MSVQFLQDAPWQSADIIPEEIRFKARDGYPLTGSYFAPANPRATVLLNAGTGIPRRFYTGFATDLARRGYAVLTYDYRGVGDAAPRRMRGFKATKVDWGRLDMSAAFAELRKRHPGLPRCVFGHSVGGQLLALMDGVEHIDAVATYGSGFGYWAQIDGAYRYLVAGLWYVGVPLFTRLMGYMPAKPLGLGEDLPAGVARDWARWGKRSTYFASEIGDAPGFAALNAPWRAFLATDDHIATPANATGLHRLYDAPIEIQWLDPEDFGCDELGHLKFFSRSRWAAWGGVADWFDQTLARRPTGHARADRLH